MLILLPPSEGKTAPSSRRQPVDLARLSFPELTQPRRTVGDALAAVSARADAMDVLGVGASLADEVRGNIDLWSAPAAPAAEVYSGVLYDALDVATLSVPARRRATSAVVVISALWGAVRLTDRIPTYRLSMTVDLPEVGALASFWRPHLTAALAPVSSRGVIVDCRSAPYQKAWPSPAADRTVQVRVVDRASGAVVSHMAKHTRGLVARTLCSRPGRVPATPPALAAAVGESFDVALLEPRSPRSPWTLVVTADLGVSG